MNAIRRAKTLLQSKMTSDEHGAKLYKKKKIETPMVYDRILCMELHQIFKSQCRDKENMRA